MCRCDLQPHHKNAPQTQSRVYHAEHAWVHSILLLQLTVCNQLIIVAQRCFTKHHTGPRSLVAYPTKAEVMSTKADAQRTALHFYGGKAVNFSSLMLHEKIIHMQYVENAGLSTKTFSLPHKIFIWRSLIKPTRDRSTCHLCLAASTNQKHAILEYSHSIVFSSSCSQFSLFKSSPCRSFGASGVSLSIGFCQMMPRDTPYSSIVAAATATVATLWPLSHHHFVVSTCRSTG